jgi:DNA-binding XRE family transcriptional regulator
MTNAKTIVRGKTKYRLVPERDYQQLVSTFRRARGTAKKAGRAAANVMPVLPLANRAGERPAVAFADATIARTIVRRREAAGLTQRELARLAKMRVETLNRAERGVVIPSVRTLTKIENALRKAVI